MRPFFEKVFWQRIGAAQKVVEMVEAVVAREEFVDDHRGAERTGFNGLARIGFDAGLDRGARYLGEWVADAGIGSDLRTMPLRDG